MRELRQGTAATVKIGPFVAATDGITLQNSLTIARANVLLSKNGGAYTQKNEVTACTVDGATGAYGCLLDATDTGTLGVLTLAVNLADSLPVVEYFGVITTQQYDAKYGTGELTVALTATEAAQLASANNTISNLATAIVGVGGIGPDTDDLLTLTRNLRDAVGTDGEGVSAHEQLAGIRAKTDLLTLTAIAGAVWSTLLAGITTTNSIGKKLKDWVIGSDNKVLLSANEQTGVTIPTVTDVANLPDISAGSLKLTYTVYVPAGNPYEGAFVEAWTDEAMTQNRKAGYTDSNGEITFGYTGKTAGDRIYLAISIPGEAVQYDSEVL